MCSRRLLLWTHDKVIHYGGAAPQHDIRETEGRSNSSVLFLLKIPYIIQIYSVRAAGELHFII